MQKRQPPQDFVQRHWPWLIGFLCTYSVMVMLLFWQASLSWLIYALATLWTAWEILAYGKGQSFHVSPGLSAQADDSMLRRRALLATAICLHCGFTALAVYGRLRALS